MPTVAATGPIFTREPINFGISRFADNRCKETTVSPMIKNGPAVLNWSVAASRGTILAKTTPRKGIKFKDPLAIPRATVPCIPITNNTPMVTIHHRSDDQITSGEPAHHPADTANELGNIRGGPKRSA